ncbi:MAG TPA: hypothetical protein VK203_07520 [Nostocaceae cyanobacterium]|nr:hypothetical protein [Nostocaceae cyanobacterium]
MRLFSSDLDRNFSIGAYFITICTKARQCLFGNVVNGEIKLNYLGQIAFNCWQEIPEHFPHIELDVFIVMPNHLHGILLITEIVEGNAMSSPHDNLKNLYLVLFLP